jgi:hypothetical protein
MQHYAGGFIALLVPNDFQVNVKKVGCTTESAMGKRFQYRANSESILVGNEDMNSGLRPFGRESFKDGNDQEQHPVVIENERKDDHCQDRINDRDPS